MKSTITLGLALMVLALGSLAGVPAAQAKTFVGKYINFGGDVCRANNFEDSGKLLYRAGAVSSTKEESTYILCPLARPIYFGDANGANAYEMGGEVRIDIRHLGDVFVEKTTECTVFSSDSATGELLAFETQSWTGTGSQRLFLNLNGTRKSSFTSTYSVLCLIPGYGQGFLNGIQLVQDEILD
jgi:hypothetical protein